MSNQGKEWFLAWRTGLEQADGVCVFFTEGNAARLNNSGIGYKEKLSSRFKQQGVKAALYLEAMAIKEIKARRPEFKIYVVDGITHTAEHLAFNLMNDAPSFGPADKWCAFIGGGHEGQGAFVEAFVSGEVKGAVAKGVVDSEGMDGVANGSGFDLDDGIPMAETVSATSGGSRAAVVNKDDCDKLSEFYKDADDVCADAIRAALSSGASNKEARIAGTNAAMQVGADEEAAACIADKQFNLAWAREKFQEKQFMLENLRPPRVLAPEDYVREAVSMPVGDTLHFGQVSSYDASLRLWNVKFPTRTPTTSTFNADDMARYGPPNTTCPSGGKGKGKGGGGGGGGRLYVGNLNLGTTATVLRQEFGKFGTISDVHLPTDSETGRVKGFAFVTFSDPMAAETAIVQMDGADVDGRQIRVNMGDSKGGGGGHGYGVGGGGGKDQRTQGSQPKRNAFSSSETVTIHLSFINADVNYHNQLTQIVVPKNQEWLRYAVRQIEAHTGIAPWYQIGLLHGGLDDTLYLHQTGDLAQIETIPEGYASVVVIVDGTKTDPQSPDLRCPITGETFVDPVATVDGVTYERAAIEHWFNLGNMTSPTTNTPLSSLVLEPDIAMKRRQKIDFYPIPIKLRALDSHKKEIDLLELLGTVSMLELLQRVLPPYVTATNAGSRTDWRGKVSTTIFVQIRSVVVLQELCYALLSGKFAQTIFQKMIGKNKKGTNKETSAAPFFADGGGAGASRDGAAADYTAPLPEQAPLSKSEEVQAWLEGIGLAQYFDRFMEEGVDEMEFVLDLEEEDIEMYQASMLTNRHREAFSTAIKELKGSRKSLPTLGKVEVDASHFAEVYENCLNAMNLLTPHQQQKLNECLEEGAGRVPIIKQDVHLMGPAGSGKTFLALHLIQLVLDNDLSANILFVVRNKALAYSVAKWLQVPVSAKRGSRYECRNRTRFSRFHVLCGDALDRFCFEVGETQLELKPIDSSVEIKYSMVVVDEAHALSDGLAANQIEMFTVSKGGGSTQASSALSPPRLQLSDVSQLTTTDEVDAGSMASPIRPVPASMRHSTAPFQLCRRINCDHGSSCTFAHSESERLAWESARSGKTGKSGASMKEVMLSEVVRCTNSRSISKVIQFSSPEREFFSGEMPYFQLYAEKTVEALAHLAAQFKGLEFNSRVAIVVPNIKFLLQFKPALQSQLQKNDQGNEEESKAFEFLDTSNASRLCLGSRSTSDMKQRTQYLVLDTVDNFNGLEWLIVIAVGLDSPSGIGSRARSNLYRGITRAQMTAVVVNEVVHGGWLEFLTAVKFAETALFDGDRENYTQQEKQEGQDVELARHQEEHMAGLVKQVINTDDGGGEEA
jgi:hypothetical protein